MKIHLPANAEIIGFRQGEYSNITAIDYEVASSFYQQIKTDDFKMNVGWSIYFNIEIERCKISTFIKPNPIFQASKKKTEDLQTIRLDTAVVLNDGQKSKITIKLTNDGPFIFTLKEGMELGNIYY